MRGSATASLGKRTELSSEEGGVSEAKRWFQWRGWRAHIRKEDMSESRGTRGSTLLLRHSEEVSVPGQERARLAQDDLVRKLGQDHVGPR